MICFILCKSYRRFIRTRCSTLCLTFLILLAFWQFLIFIKLFFIYDKENQFPVFIWWTSNFTGTEFVTCANNRVCRFSHNRSLKNSDDVKGYLFYGSEFDVFDLPLPRNGTEKIWALLHEESPRNMPILLHEPALTLFNYSSTISRHSHVPLTLQYLNSIDDLIDGKYFIETKKKNELLKNLSPILFIQSDCETSSYRDYYVEELMKYIAIDSYGECLNNKKLPSTYKYDYLNKLNDHDFLTFVSRYKFTIAIENGICEDYITEKLWRPLKVGSVPIYMGSPSIRDWLPNQQSAIILNDFESLKDLATYLNHLNKHDDDYEKYLQHKINNQITNSKLIDFIKQHNNEGVELFSDTFQCFICNKHYEENIISSVITQSHYNCTKPVPPVKSLDTWWLSEWYNSEKEAKVLNKFVIQENRHSFTRKEFFIDAALIQSSNADL